MIFENCFIIGTISHNQVLSLIVKEVTLNSK